MSFLRSFWVLLGMLVALTSLSSAQESYKYSYIPKKVYKNQIFPVTVIDTSGEAEEPEFQFDLASATQPLFEKPLVIRNGNDRFYTFYFKVKDTDVRIPKLNISSESFNTSLPAHMIFLTSLNPRDDFCGVLAADMKIKSYQVSNYDEKHYLVTLSLEAHEANLEDMRIDHFQESGVEGLERNNAKAEAEFYIVLSSEEKVLKFTYFNTIKKQYVFLETPIDLADDTVTTQSDLNPKEDSFEQLKQYSLIFLTLFFLLMAIFKRDFFYLVLGTVSFITLLTLFIPHARVCVQQGASLYILPTSTSTVSTRVDERFEATLLGERGTYKKVEYKEGIIGWIKDEDLCKN